MTPTEINILIALLATVFGFAIRHAWAKFYLDKDAAILIDQWEKMYRELKRLKTSNNFATAKFVYVRGFRDGFALADEDVDAEDDEDESPFLNMPAPIGSYVATAQMKEFFKNN